MNKTDLVFYLSTLASLGTLFVRLTGNLISSNTATWIGVAATLISALAFALYEKFTGNQQPPTPHQA